MIPVVAAVRSYLCRWKFRPIIGGLLGLLLFYQLWLLAHVLWWIQHNPQDSAFMRAGIARLHHTHPDASLKHQWVNYQYIAPWLKSAVIAAEDARFLQHQGFDWDGIEKAWDKDVQKHRIIAGGSTISQQLAKNLFLSGQRTPWRKLEESCITVMLEHLLSKRRILELYLNCIEWGNGIYGAEAASEHYFHLHAHQLSRTQAAWLAAIIPNPRFYDLHRHGYHLMHKSAILQHRMQHVAIPH